MKLALSATGRELDSQLDPRFGRSAYFIIVDTDDMSFKAFENEQTGMTSGAGISSANFVISKGIKAVLTGNCGPKAMQVFSAAGIDVFTGQTGSVKDAVENYKKGNLQSTTTATVPEKAGVSGTYTSTGGQGRGSGQGVGGGGRGMGMGGGGRGMGGGRRCMSGGGRGMNTYAGSPAFNQTQAGAPLTKEEELRILKEQSAALKKQMQDIESKINSLK